MNTTTARISYAYFIKADKYVKIGKTDVSICNRIYQMQTGNPYILSCPYYIAIAHANRSCPSPAMKVEMLIQSICTPAKKRAEWFQYHDAMRLVFENWQAIYNKTKRNPDILSIAIRLRGEEQYVRYYPYSGIDDEETRISKFLRTLNKRRN